mmetsp:Transcript_24074/g.61279  ORF Transcript_24074/g.61279 Transcript_24074/m.61279 type:complete len:222 (-) Transcript_24074:390-1055(-)
MCSGDSRLNRKENSGLSCSSSITSCSKAQPSRCTYSASESMMKRWRRSWMMGTSRGGPTPSCMLSPVSRRSAPDDQAILATTAAAAAAAPVSPTAPGGGMAAPPPAGIAYGPEWGMRVAVGSLVGSSTPRPGPGHTGTDGSVMALPHPMRSSKSCRMMPSIASMALAASSRFMKATKPQFRPLRRCSSSRGHMTLTLPMAPKRPNSLISTFSSTSGARLPT